MDKERLIESIRENEQEMYESLKRWDAESWRLIFRDYTDEIIKIVEDVCNGD